MMVTKWRGYGKIIEETGELCTELGKLVAFPTGDHPDGRGVLQTRIENELADVVAAIGYFIQENSLNRAYIMGRARNKEDLFRMWGLSGINLEGKGKSKS